MRRLISCFQWKTIDGIDENLRSNLSSCWGDKHTSDVCRQLNDFCVFKWLEQSYSFPSYINTYTDHVITFRVRRSRGEIYIGHGRLCVCLSLAAFPHYCTDPDVPGRNGRSPFSWALLGGFTIGARVSLLWQHSAVREMSASACARSMPG